jgi:prepilin-type N-terminal cleavage/methylation domain-containing protein
MSVISHTARHLAHQERGFTLIEVLVAMLTSVVVTGALFAILQISLNQTSRITDRVQATQLGRTAMTKMVDELHSACLARAFAPVQEESSAKELRFATGFSEKAVIEYKEASEHRIAWTGTYPKSGNLIDKTYNATSASTWPKFEFEEKPASEILLATRVYAPSETVPVFRYYKYSATTSAGTETAPAGTLTSVEPPEKGFTAKEANGIAAVQVSFSQAPSNNNLKLGRPVEFASLATFAFASPNSEATITDGPCQ